jgi:hypothetical protein
MRLLITLINGSDLIWLRKTQNDANGPKQTFANLRLLLGRKLQRGRLLGHLRGLRVQHVRRRSVLDFRWIRERKI